MLRSVLFNPFFLLIAKALDFAVWKVGNYFQYCRIINYFPSAGEGLTFDKTTVFKYRENIEIGLNVSIGPGVTIGAKSKVVLDNYVRISQNVIIETAGCDLDTSIPYKHKSSPILLAENVWVGSNAIILGGVTIGKNSIIGAGAVVYKSVPENSIVLPATSSTILNKRLESK